jgi:hypothetical protein
LHIQTGDISAIDLLRAATVDFYKTLRGDKRLGLRLGAWAVETMRLGSGG